MMLDKSSGRLSRSRRLNHILNRMRDRQDITPATLAEELKVSERTVYRDLKSLETDQALQKRYSRSEGRYLLEDELSLPPIHLTPSEALAIMVGAVTPALMPGGLYENDLRDALAKVYGALRAEDELTVEMGWRAIKSVLRPRQERILRAIREKRKLRLVYWSVEEDQAKPETVAPYALREAEGVPCLLAHFATANQVLLLPLESLCEADILEERFRFPHRAALETHFQRAQQTFHRYREGWQIEIRFSAEVAEFVRNTRGAAFARLETQEDGSLLGAVYIRSRREWVWWLLSLGSAAEVLAPADFRAHLAQTTQAMAARYAAGGAES